MDTNNKPRNNSVFGVLFIGCMFMGLGVGLLTGYLKVGIFMGMAVGLIAALAFKASGK